jgi:hypothetical protein
MNLSFKVTPCANGETHEYRLFIGHEQVGRSVFLTGQIQMQEALRRIVRSL